MDPKISYETIDKSRLARLPKYELPPTYYLQEQPGGNACFLDPPGYPTYFTRSVYTQYGNSPAKSARLLLLGRVVKHANDWKGCKDWDEYRAKINKRLARLYKPLPLDHPRVRAWIQELYGYFKNCYADPTVENKRHADKLVIWPVPDYKYQHFQDDKRFSDEWRTQQQRAIAIANAEITEKARQIAKPENHAAVLAIQEHYPDYQPELDLIENPPEHPGDWWERYDVKPTPANCPGLRGRKHPASGTWCQMCGFRGELPAPA